MELKKVCNLIEKANECFDAFNINQLGFVIGFECDCEYQYFNNYKELAKWLKKEYTKSFYELALSCDYHKEDGYWKANFDVASWSGVNHYEIKIWCYTK